MTTPRYGLDISSNMHDTYQKGGDFTINGQCSRCGACCTHHLMVTKKEQQQIKAYIKQHHIQHIRHGNPDEHSIAIDLVCPFLNDKGIIMSCTIYPVRPVICRLYQCNLSEEETSRRLGEALKQGTVTLFDISHEINVPSTFFPDEYLPKPHDLVIINQLHMLEFKKHANEIFQMTDKQRFQNRRHEVFLTHTKDSSKNMWFDIMGLTKVDILS